MGFKIEVWRDTLPPLFHMEQKKDDCGDTYEAVRRITEPIFREVLHEVNSDTMGIRYKGYELPIRPNNLRRQIKTRYHPDTTKKGVSTLLPNNDITESIKKTITIRDYKGTTLMLFKGKLTSIYSQKIINGEKEITWIQAKSKKEFFEKLDIIKGDIQKKLDNALFSFMKLLNISLHNTYPIWERAEMWYNDSLVSKLPEEEIIHTDDYKKVYPTGIEAKSNKGEDPTAKLKRVISNSFIHDFSPEIEEGLIELADSFNPLGALKNKVNSIKDVIENKRIVQKLSRPQRKDFTRWLFLNFGVSA